jgi:regulator of protease activity HflC (stomatin/prohibitin superfamily)
MSNDELSLDDMRSALAKWLAGLDGRQQNKRSIAGLLEAAFQRIDALKTRVEVLDVAFANSHQLNESLGDENRALRARVEAAEAEVARIERARLYYQERTVAVTAALDVERANNKAAWQRVAELEAQLAAPPAAAEATE